LEKNEKEKKTNSRLSVSLLPINGLSFFRGEELKERYVSFKRTHVIRDWLRASNTRADNG